MPIDNITQSVSTIPAPPHRGVDVQTVFVNKQEDFQDHLADITIDELNTLKDQLNTRIGEINSTATTMNGYANTASAGASTATTKAGEASTSASEALTSRNQAETFKNNASASATKASQWADNNYNVEVETGKYSAKHWATVAQSAVVGEDTKGTNIASASTITIGTAGLGDYIHITGTTTIASFGTAANAGLRRTLIFDGALTITNGANLICVGGTNIVTVANTIVSAIAESTTQWRVEYVIHPSVSFAELGYLDGVTSAIQTQLNSKFTTASATESTQGLIELATTAETQAGTDDSRAITPLKLRNALNASGAAPIYACRAWVNFNGTGTVAIRAGGNVSSITDNGVGDYTVNFTTAMPDANYSLSGTAAFFYNGVPAAILVEASDGISGTILKTISALRLYTVNNNDDSVADAGSINISIFR